MFFQTMFQMMSPGVDYNLTMSRTESKMTVLVMPKVNGLEDTARHNLVPFTLCATADEIDRGFFPALQQPLPTAATLLTNMADFEKRANQAAANSKSAKSEKAKVDKDEKQKKEKYDAHMKKAEELEAAENFDGAVMQLQQTRLHATEKDAKTVDEKIATLKAKASQGLLFDVPATEPAPEASQPVIATAQPAQPEQTAPQPTATQPAPEQPQPAPQQAPQPAYPPMQGQPLPPQTYPGYPQMPQAGQPYGHGMFGASTAPVPVPGQGYPSQPNAQPIPQGGGYPPPIPAFASGDFPHDPKAYEGIPDVQYTHVASSLNNPQQPV